MHIFSKKVIHILWLKILSGLIWSQCLKYFPKIYFLRCLSNLDVVKTITNPVSQFLNVYLPFQQEQILVSLQTPIPDLHFPRTIFSSTLRNTINLKWHILKQDFTHLLVVVCARIYQKLDSIHFLTSNQYKKAIKSNL